MHDVLVTGGGWMAVELFASFNDETEGSEESNGNVEFKPIIQTTKSRREGFSTCFVLKTRSTKPLQQIQIYYPISSIQWTEALQPSPF